MQADEIHSPIHPCEGGDKQDHLLPVAKAVRQEGKCAVQPAFHFLHQLFPDMDFLIEQGLDALYALLFIPDILRFQRKRVLIQPFQPPCPGIPFLWWKKPRFLLDPHRFSAVLDKSIQTIHIRLILHE